MKNVLIQILLIGIFMKNSYASGQVLAVPAPFGPHLWTATVKVIGEDGNPILGAGISVQYNIPGKEGSGQLSYGEIKGSTDANGIFDTSHTDSSWGLAIIVEKSGYYTTHMGYQFYFSDTRQNPIFTLVLKKIGTPIPMYAKKEEVKIPKENESVGLDLMFGDWVAPYGAGKTADLFFTVHRNIFGAKVFDADLKLIFANNGDGIAIVPPVSESGSPLVMPHFAVETGYQPGLTWSYHNFTETATPASGYFIRVRTVLDSNGNVKSARYGKIQGDIKFLVGTRAPQAGIAFNYYLNPTPNDRNVEFDPKQNLLVGLKSSEQVSAP